jgi:histone acetyltransferase (RNA polymerase elongator complex component)
MTIGSFKTTIFPNSNLRHERPLIIPIFLPHMGCPHQCLFCNQTSITGHSHQLPSKASISHQIERFLAFDRKKRPLTEVSFYGGNFLGLSFDQIANLLSYVSEFVQDGSVNGIRFSTRPDTIDPERLELIASFPITTIELGIQSMNDQVLSLACRGHTNTDIQMAVTLLKQTDYAIGLQMMIGLPGDTFEGLITSTRQVVALKPDFVRIYPTLVIKGSPLSKWYQVGKYRPLSLSAAIIQTKHLFLMCQQKGIAVIRMGLQASDELSKDDTVLAGPYHPAFGHLVLSSIYLDAIKQMISQIKLKTNKGIQIYVNPKDISRVEGLKKKNLTLLKKEFDLFRIKVMPDASMSIGTLSIKTD